MLAAAACGFANAQTTAYTTPVGYVSLDIPAAADSTFTAPLSKAPLLQAVSTAVSGNQITVSSTGAADGGFINAGSSDAKTYILVTSGALTGLRFPVTANSGTSVTVNGGATSLQVQGFVSGDSISVVPYWTLGTLFPGGAGVGASQDIYDPLAYVLVSDQETVGTNRGTASIYFYADGTDSNPVGWRNLADPEGAIQDTVAIDPAITYTIRTGTAAQTLTISGQVPSTALATTVLTGSVSNDEYLSNPFPIDTTLAQSGLQSVISASSDIYDPTEYVLVNDDLAAGQNKGASAIYFYHNGADGNAAGWKDLADPEGANVTSAILKAGRCFTIRKASGSSSVTKWTAPVPYTL
jgi:uncharacterized protein (TIGR02597 family)